MELDAWRWAAAALALITNELGKVPTLLFMVPNARDQPRLRRTALTLK